MKQILKKLFVLLLSTLVILPSLSQAELSYNNIQTTINPLISNISKSYLNNNEDLIVFIQDMHSNPQVQKNIYETISFFDKKYGINKILVEGVPYSKTDTSFISSLKNYNNKILDYLLTKGFLTGTEYFLIKENTSVPVYGLENWEVYLNNIKLLANINSNLKASNEVFAEFYKTILERTKSKKLLKYVDFDITDTKLLKKVNQPILKYNILNKYIVLSDIKKNFDNKSITKEHLQFINILKSSLDFTSYKNIIDKSKNKDLTEYWQLLYKQILKNKNYQTDYKNLFSYLDYLVQINNLNLVSLIYQQNEYFKDYLNNLYETDKNNEEKIFILKMTNLFGKIINLSISEYEYDFFINNFDRYKLLLEKYLTINDLIKFNTIIEFNKFLEYYNTNKQRNIIFEDNILNSISEKKDNIHKNKRVTIIVAGGFHSSILNSLQEKNLQYLLITPYSKINKVTDAYSKIVSSTYEQQMLAQIPIMLANSPLVPKHTRDLFLAELTEAFIAVYDESPTVIEEHIRNLVRKKWAEPLNIHIKDDNFNIYIGNQVISFNIKNNRIDFTNYKIGPIEESTIFIRDFSKGNFVEYTISIDGETFIFEIEKDIASHLTPDTIQRIIDEIKNRIEQKNISFIKQDSENKELTKISVKTFEKSNSTDLFIDNISESNTFFINKNILKTKDNVRNLFLEVAMIHAIIFSFFDKTVFDKNLLIEEDIKFILTNIDKDSFGFPDIEKLKKSIETEFSKKEVRILSQLKKYSGNLELLIQAILERDFISEYRLPHWKHIVSQYFAPSKGESKKSVRKRHIMEKEFFSKIIVDNSQEESLQEFLDRRISLERQQKIKDSIKYVAQYLIDSAPEKDTQDDIQKIANQIEQQIYDCLELMYRSLPKHAFEKFINEKGVVADHNFNHSIKLIENVIYILKTENKSFTEIDFTIIVYAALMHDLACTFFRDNHERNSAILAGEILKKSSFPERLQRKIVASCLGHEKIGDKGERVEHKIYEARLIHDADGLSAVMALGRIIGVWMKSKEPFFVKERTIAERLDLIERDRFLYTEGGDAINDLLRQFVRMKPSRYLTTGAQTILRAAMRDGEETLISLLNEYKEKIIETYGINEETFKQATETIKIMFRNKRYNEILGRTHKQIDSHDDIFDFSRDIDTDNTLLIDVVTTKEELYRIEKAERAGLNTLTISFSDDNILSDIPLTDIINLNKKDENGDPIQEITINETTYFININLNIIKLNSAYSEYMKVLTIEAPGLPNEFKPEIIKYITQEIVNNSDFSKYIKTLENIAIINFDQAQTEYESLTKTRKLSKYFANILTKTWGEIPALYDLRTEKQLVLDSNTFEIDNINAILSAA